MNTAIDIKQRNLRAVGRTAELLKTIAEENRLKILYLLKDGERCVCDIWQDLEIPQNLASHHLKVLKDSGLIDSRRMGLKIFYWLDTKTIKKFNLTLNNFLRPHDK